MKYCLCHDWNWVVPCTEIPVDPFWWWRGCGQWGCVWGWSLAGRVQWQFGGGLARARKCQARVRLPCTSMQTPPNFVSSWYEFLKFYCKCLWFYIILTTKKSWTYLKSVSFMDKCCFWKHENWQFSTRRPISLLFSHFPKWVRRAFCACAASLLEQNWVAAATSGQNQQTFKAQIITAL